MEEKDKEELEVSKLYKRAFNDAELVINQFPHLVDKLEVPKGEPTDYTRGFQDRIAIFNKEKEMIRNFSIEEMRERYRDKDLDKDKGIEEKDKECRERDE